MFTVGQRVRVTPVVQPAPETFQPMREPFESEVLAVRSDEYGTYVQVVEGTCSWDDQLVWVTWASTVLDRIDAI